MNDAVARVVELQLGIVIIHSFFFSLSQNGGSHPIPGLRSAIDEGFRLDNWPRSVYDQCNMENYGRTCKIMIDRGGPNHVYEFADTGRITFLQGPGAIVVRSQEREMSGVVEKSPTESNRIEPCVSLCFFFLLLLCPRPPLPLSRSMSAAT